ncbi:MAG: aminotransferase class I/II-fold pyridoxal phosphate-dependent enzyme, partial [Nitriliruptoraceae bacterium]
HDRSRTTVAHRPPLAIRLAPEIPPGVVDAATGNPDPALLPDLHPALAGLSGNHRLYGEDPAIEILLDLARTDLGDDLVPTEHLAVVGGALDGIERVLEVHTRLGDRIGVEDPCYIGTLDLIRTLGLVPVPIRLDDEGPDPESLADALDQGLAAVLLVPRAQNPFGAALSATRAADIRRVLDADTDLLVIEDDPAAWISGTPHHVVITDRPRWAVVRSLAKSLGPDLRTAVLAADEDTITRVRGRQRLGTGWVSHLLQRLSASVWALSLQDGTLERAAQAYAERRRAVLDTLAEHDLIAHGASGLNVWVPVAEEVPVVQSMASRGWAIQAGEPFRIESDPGVRITVAAVPPEAGVQLATDLAEILGMRLGTRRG